MSRTERAPRTLHVERHLPQPPARVWRALTKSWLVEQWLMSNDMVPEVGRRFAFRAQGGLTRCEVLAVEEPCRLAWRWGDGRKGGGALRTVVTWTLEPSGEGTLLRLEHAGFGVRDERACEAMRAGWPRVLARLAEVVGEGR
ncbi:MAG: SRPBCC domain-containing protein [Deltaproteobacteria bacterium]|nr:SRPBCC domain-containing protein [Deltaproteobacteria bacterium]